MKMTVHAGWISALAILGSSAPLLAEDLAPKSRGDQEREALSPFQGIVGNWRSSGLWAEKSAGEPWQERAEWSWEIGRAEGATEDSYHLVGKIEDGRIFRTLRVSYRVDSGDYMLDAVRTSGEAASYAGSAKGSRLVLEEVTDGGRATERVTIQPLHANRHLVLVERRNGGKGAFRKFAEIGATKEGEAFVEVDPAKMCPVTGGAGAIAVVYNGKTYYVCCTGCRDVFDADPERFLRKR